MMAASVQITEEKLDANRVNDICENLSGDKLRILSLRECELTDKGYNAIVKAVGQSKSLLQLSLSLGIIKDLKRVDGLCKALQKNQSLVALFIHGNPLGNKGMIKLCKVLSQHRGIVSLDVGDCELGDKSLNALCDLLPANGEKPGLLDISLSANTRISPTAWTRFGLAVAASSSLRELYVDYNKLGDFAASCLLVGLASSRKVQVLDLEGTGITEKTAQLILHLVENYPVQLKKVILDENDIEDSTKLTINDYIENNNDEDDSTSVQTMDSKAEALGTTSRKIESKSTSKSSKSSDEISSESESVTDDEEEDEEESENSESEQSMSSTLKSEKSKENESDLKDTVKTDEDYKALEQALEEVGQSTGKISTLSGTMETEKSRDSDEEGDELTEVPVISTTPVLTMVKTNTQKIQKVDDEEDDSDNDSGDELHEIYMRQ